MTGDSHYSGDDDDDDDDKVSVVASVDAVWSVADDVVADVTHMYRLHFRYFVRPDLDSNNH